MKAVAVTAIVWHIVEYLETAVPVIVMLARTRNTGRAQDATQKVLSQIGSVSFRIDMSDKLKEIVCLEFQNEEAASCFENKVD